LFHLTGVGQPDDQAKQAFIELHDRLGPRLLAYLVRRVPDTEVAAELWAESWAAAFEGWGRVRSKDPRAAEAWVFGIARHQLAAYYRSGSIERRALQRLRWTVPTIDGALDEELDRLVDRDALRAEIGEALEALSPDRRDAVRLRIVDGLGYDAVAARLGCSEQTARAHVSRGLRRLARALNHTTSRSTEMTTR
jgi:RNA polymerase sigma factor (sigma-70 family)